jgi:hypothetical protein
MKGLKAFMVALLAQVDLPFGTMVIGGAMANPGARTNSFFLNRRITVRL